MRLIYFAVLFLTSIQAIEGQTPKKTPPASAASATQPKFKAIWEPANYPKDINLLDVKFVSAEEGWAVGARTRSCTPRTARKRGRLNWEAIQDRATES